MLSFQPLIVLCSQVLSIQQLYRISTMYWDDKYGTHSVSPDVSFFGTLCYVWVPFCQVLLFRALDLIFPKYFSSHGSPYCSFKHPRTTSFKRDIYTTERCVYTHIYI